MKAIRFAAVAVLTAAFVGVAPAMDHPMPGMGPGVNGARYATDAYPGFDDTEEMTKPERKEPRWLSFIFGPNRDNATDQFAYCTQLVGEESYSKACGQLDALVREWPTSPEAPKAQRMLADLRYERLKDYEEAFADYRYLLDFYSLQCGYEKMADRLYEVAGMMKLEGKEVMFIRFANTVDVRRAYETCVLRAPGAKWVPEAMLIIGALRVDEGKYEAAAKVYENLRNIHPDSEQATDALMREAEVRMTLLREREYNRLRCRDTVDFLTLALRRCRPSDAEVIRGHLEEAKAQLEREAYLGAKFYDSSTRTRRSAVTAYEKFLAEYPESEHAEEIRARLEVLKDQGK